MDGCGPDDVAADELKRAKTWREVRAELSKGVSPKWDGASTRNTRLWKASLERKLAQKIVPGAVHGLLLGVYDGSVDETAAGLLRLRELKSGAPAGREEAIDPFALLADDSCGVFAKVKREKAARAVTPDVVSRTHSQGRAPLTSLQWCLDP